MSKLLKAIREKCVDCCGGSRKDVRVCQISDCALHPYRFGTNPLHGLVGKSGNNGGVSKSPAVPEASSKSK